MPPKKELPILLPTPVNTAAEDFEARVKDATSMVDLTVAFTPVLPLRTGSHPAANVPVKVKQDEDGFYLLQWYGAPAEKVTAEQLRSMRARYILRHNDYYSRLPMMGPRERDRIIETFFNGQAVFMLGALELTAETLKSDGPTRDGMPAPILTIKYEEGNPDAVAAALTQAIDALGPAVSLKSRQQMNREDPGGIRYAMEAEMRGEDPAPGVIGDYYDKLAYAREKEKEWNQYARDAEIAKKHREAGWKMVNTRWVKQVGPFNAEVWPAGTWGITADGKTVAHGSSGIPAASDALQQLLDDSGDHDGSAISTD